MAPGRTVTTRDGPGIVVDRSPSSVVAVCPCGWRTVTATLDATRAAAAAHEQRAHPDRKRARSAAHALARDRERR